MTMAVKTSCPNCFVAVQIAEEKLGRKVRCPSCREIFTAEAPEEDDEPELDRQRGKLQAKQERHEEIAKRLAPAAKRYPHLRQFVSLVKSLSLLATIIVGLLLSLGIVGAFTVTPKQPMAAVICFALFVLFLVARLPFLAIVDVMAAVADTAEAKAPE